MKLSDLNKDDLQTLARNVKRNPEHLKKIAMGHRPCPAMLAKQIEEATAGLIKKEELVWPTS